MIKNFINKIENIEISFWGVIFLIYIAIFFRTFLENYANTSNLRHMTGFTDTFLGYPAWFSIIFLAVFIIARILTKEKIQNIAKLVALSSFIITTPPIIDLIINKGKTIPYIFISGSYPELFKSFISYFGGRAIGTGIKTEVAMVLIGFGFYIFHKTKEIKKVILGVFLLYSTIFILLASPVFVFDLQNKITNQAQTINTNTTINFYFYKEPLNSTTSSRTFITDTVTDNTFYSPVEQKILNQYSTTFAIIFLFTNMLLLFWCLYLHSPEKFFAVLKNFRYLRIMHYFLLASVGIYFGTHILGKNPFGSLFDLVSIASLFLALLCSWLFAVFENDEIDIEIDRVSNKERPLVTANEIFPASEWRDFKYVFLAFSLSFAFLCGLYSFVFILLFTFVYHIYSAPPLHLKRFLGISSFLIAVNALLAVWMGFFIVSSAENLIMFPVKYSLGILLLFFLVENTKNIKDIEGDKREGIKTIPVIFGEIKGKLIISICLFLATLLVPIIFYFSLYTFILAIIFGLILFKLTNRKNFNEDYIFLTYFVYIILFFLLAHF